MRGTAVFHLRCLNLHLDEDEDMPEDWRCRICLHEAKARGAPAQRSLEAAAAGGHHASHQVVKSPAPAPRASSAQRRSGEGGCSAARGLVDGKGKPPSATQGGGQGAAGAAVAGAGAGAGCGGEGRGGEVGGQEAQALCGLGAASCQLPEEPVLCSSCGFFEQESVKCHLCARWFCFGCTALSLQVVGKARGRARLRASDAAEGRGNGETGGGGSE